MLAFLRGTLTRKRNTSHFLYFSGGVFVIRVQTYGTWYVRCTLEYLVQHPSEFSREDLVSWFGRQLYRCIVMGIFFYCPRMFKVEEPRGGCRGRSLAGACFVHFWQFFLSPYIHIYFLCAFREVGYVCAGPSPGPKPSVIVLLTSLDFF